MYNITINEKMIGNHNNKSTTNFTDYTFHSHEWWLQFGGSLPWSDAIGMFVMPPIVAVGIILNLVGFLVLQFSQTFKQAKIYTYLKFNFLNGFVCNSTGMFYPFCVVRRYLPFANTYFALWYMNAIGLPIANVCYYYNMILDILVTFEKLSIFVKRLENLNKKYFTRPEMICIIVFMAVLLIDLPYFFFYTPSSQLVYFSPNETYEFTNYHISEFTRSKLGQIILYIQYVIRDIIPLILLIGLNLALVYQLKLFIEKKKGMTAQVGIVNGKELNKTNPAIKKMQKSQVNQSIMVILICVSSLIKSSIILISIVYSSVQQGIVANLLGTFSDFVIYSITTFNFFIVFFLDGNFNKFFTNKS
jgi:hypothetical protein